MTPRHFTSLKHESGFTLIESMVAIVIMAMGLIGLALMQAQGLKFTDGAYSRTQASMLANDIIDRIRVHADSAIRQHEQLRRNGVADGDTTEEIDDYLGAFVTASNSIQADSGMCVYGDSIDPGDLILIEVACWKDDIDAQLNGTANISFRDDNTSIEVTINWLDRQGRSADQTNNTNAARSLTIVSEFGNLEWD